MCFPGSLWCALVVVIVAQEERVSTATHWKQPSYLVLEQQPILYVMICSFYKYWIISGEQIVHFHGGLLS